LFEANHRWAMAQGEESLKLELARRRAISDAARAAVPPPPGPVTYAAAGLLAGTLAAAGVAAYLVVRATRKRGRPQSTQRAQRSRGSAAGCRPPSLFATFASFAVNSVFARFACFAVDPSRQGSSAGRDTLNRL